MSEGMMAVSMDNTKMNVKGLVIRQVMTSLIREAQIPS